MMKVEQIATAGDLEAYIEGCLNDFELGISGKEETLANIAELVAYIYNKAKDKNGS